MNLTFDEATHIYRLDGEIIPNVTHILSSEGFVDSSRFTEYSRDRGTKVHRAIKLYEDDDLAEDKLDPVLRPYLEAWKRFKAESGWDSEATEVPLASEIHRFGGTIDHQGHFPSEALAVLDTKTGEVEPWVAIQTALYEILVGKPCKRYALQLKNNGMYKLHPFEDRTDRNVALAALTVHQWKRRANGNNRG